MKDISTKLNGALQIHNSHFLSYSDERLTIDVLGGVDTLQVERMICTLRITYQKHPSFRTTLDLYSDSQVDKLIRSLCDKWNLKLTESSNSVHSLITQLENYRFKQLKYSGPIQEEFEMNQEEAKAALRFLKSKNLTGKLKKDFEQIGILGEEQNALILFLAIASHRFSDPFSVLCLAKSGVGKSYLLQKLSECLPESWFSYHTQISENALYYFESHQIDGKVLFIEDLEWTQKMLTPLSALQSTGRLVKTRATKDKDGMLHSTTFEVLAKLCLIGCAYSEKNFDSLSLPFLCLHLNHSFSQDKAIMDYQKKCKAGLINQSEVAQTQRRLKCVLASLEDVNVINPYAPLIELPKEFPHPRKNLLLLLNFIDIITFFFQHQRRRVAADNNEKYIETHPEDIELAFSLLKNSLLRRVDELSTSARGFYDWLQKFLAQAQTKQFGSLDIRKVRQIHPRTLNRYLQELTLFHYIRIVGGNKHREGYLYQITSLDELGKLQKGIQASLEKTLETIKAQTSQPPVKQAAKQPTKVKPTQSIQKSLL